MLRFFGYNRENSLIHREETIMKKTAILFAEGYEEVEALTVVDLLRRAKIGCDIKARRDGRMVLERAILSQDERGELQVMPLKKQSSALYGALQKCNCLAVIPAGGGGLAAGEQVTCILTCADEMLPLSC